ncbi:uncharacterized protein LOC111046367 [Nilaparvata lugens]|uniref:uncharacterized protein LOC111046367 n=1 Tax=Nilaparvata lugens TaxID=108931 RepID=UPI00193E0D18|nr:uncharacterized protein LOC111046367 [Nilaparvata lugens]XP_022187582.2 uncharacterized protein LOC111046367 [Nilaparvata lugens]XP_022187583.2 uncharacterized protein LOC111046367 [Nilaparvata lugens]XP_039276828.1 uncharacterized protein LOC111046367 [Nilaparvata lugens]XP_039276829.1 uncharacterized protein LOC111046367 [Nilaparvata lugens]
MIFYNPFTPSPAISFSSFTQYLLILPIELWYIHLSFTLAFVLNESSFLAVDNVVREMKLFQMNLQELNMNADAIEEQARSTPNTTEDYSRLKVIVRQISIHHQLIYKKVGMLNKGFDFQVMYNNTFICFHLCLAIFCMVKVDLLYKIKYGVSIFAITIISFMYSENGQRLENEGENLRLALYSCSWIGKPSWFCRSLLILVTQNNRIPKLETFKIFTLNRNNLKVVMQAAYSYFSVLTRFSR